MDRWFLLWKTNVYLQADIVPFILDYPFKKLMTVPWPRKEIAQLFSPSWSILRGLFKLYGSVDLILLFNEAIPKKATWAGAHAINCGIFWKRSCLLFLAPRQTSWSSGSPWSKLWFFPSAVALHGLHLGKCSLSCRMRWLWFGNWPFLLITGTDLISLKLIIAISRGNKDSLLFILILSSDVSSRLILSCKSLMWASVTWRSGGRGRSEGRGESPRYWLDVFALLFRYLLSLETL